MTADIVDGSGGSIVVNRTVECFAAIPPSSYSFNASQVDLQAGESLTDFIARNRTSGETARDFALELDLIEGLSVHLQVIETYEDGSSKRVDTAHWENSND